MFNCPKCGAEVRHGAKFCEHCACEMNWDSVGSQADNAGHVVSEGAKWSTLSIIGFVLSLVMSGIISLILSIIGYKECKEKGYQGGGFALAGIIISIISMVTAVIAIIVMIVLVGVYGITIYEIFDSHYYYT